MQNKNAEALAAYKEVEAIYSKNPDDVDAEYASILEAYADLLSRTNQTVLSQQVYANARNARKIAYKKK
jgi:hypothetical protein